MTHIDPVNVARNSNPYTLPADQHGWRGLTVPGHHKRKVYTLLHNESVLVTALLLMPGEASIRHSHETGELSIHYNGEMKPGIYWHPGGEIHSGSPAPPEDEATRRAREEEMVRQAGDSPMVALVEQLLADQREMRQRLDAIAKAAITPRIIVDVLFPPFKTTIHDPAYANEITIEGQWYD